MYFTTRWRALAYASLVTLAINLIGSNLWAQSSSTAPYFDPIPDRETTVDNSDPRHPPGHAFVVSATNATSITATGLPGTTGPVTGTNEIIYTYYETQLPAGAFTVTVTATSGSGETLTRSFKWTVHPSIMSWISADNATYHVGDTITLSLTYSSVVVVSGTPYIELWPGKHVPYASGSGTHALTFRGMIDGSDTTHVGLMPDRVTLGDGAITTTDGVSANLIAGASPNGIGGMQYPFDVIASSPPGGPVINGIRPPVPGLYGNSRGGLTFIVDFNAKVVVTGQPSIVVRAGSDEFEFNQAQVIGDGSQVVFFLDWATPLTANGPLSITGPIRLNGGTIKGTDGTDAVLTFTPVDVPTVVFDTTPPAQPVISGVTPQNPTPDQSFTISGTGEPNAGLSCRLDGNFITTKPIDAAGNWSVTVPAQPAGSHTFEATAVDAAHNLSPTATMTVTVQSTPPSNTPPPTTSGAPQTITFSSPVSAIVVGQPVTLGATASSGLPVTYTVISGDATVSGNVLTPRSTATLIVRASQAGNANFAAASTDVNFGNPQKAAQTISLAATGGKVPAEVPLSLNASSTSGLPVTYSIVSGPATISGNTLTFTGTGTVLVRASQSGDGTYAAANDVTLSFDAIPVSRLLNLSARLKVNPGDASQGGIAGFVVTGKTAKRVLIRAVGPTLAQFGIASPLAEPQLRLTNATGVTIGSNAGWNDDAQITAAGDGVGAFRLRNGSKDAALLLTLDPGAYTALVSSNGSGTALLEVYDVEAGAAVPTKELINLSARALVGTGDEVLIGGISVGGTEPKRVLIRAVGPGLATYGVGNVLADPVLTLRDLQGNLIASNDNWESEDATVPAGTSTAAIISAADAATGAFALRPGSTDAALVVTLKPGTYSAVVNGAGGATGAAIVEAYEIPDTP